MKKILLFGFTLLSIFASAQTYPSQGISLISLLNPNTSSVGIGTDNRRYNSCWGWVQPVTNKEYAILGASNGVYFYDISTPASPSLCAFVPGKPGCTWREMKTYQNYCYIVSDDPAPNTFQIIDMSTLPSTVSVVHNGTTYFERGHTIFIDNDHMYIGSTTYTSGGGFSSMNVYSLATPTAPAFLRSLGTDYPGITHVHDMFVKNDTVFASCGNQGLYIYRFLASTNSFTQLGSYTNYAGSPYNHSSWITDNRQYLVFCDEVPGSLPIKLVDVQNLNNVQPVSTFNPHTNTTPHNPYVVGNNYAFVACYQDGLNMYNIGSPSTPFLAGYFDTHPQGGFNTGNYGGTDYRGNWGAYPYLPSGVILASDMQNGLFLLDVSQAYFTGVDERKTISKELNFFPNPASDKFAIMYNTSEPSCLKITNMIGQIVYEKFFNSNINEYIEVDHLANGTYILSLKENEKIITKKLIIRH